MMLALYYYLLVVIVFFTVGVILIVRGGGSTATRLMRIAALLVVPAVFFLWFACYIVKNRYSDATEGFVVNLRWALQNESLPDAKIVAAFSDDPDRTEFELRQLNRK